MPSATAAVPAVLSTNVFKPALGGTLGISLLAPQDGEVTVNIYNLGAEKVRLVLKTSVTKGLWLQANWDGKNDYGEAVSSGVYFISIRGAGIKQMRKVVVLK